MEANTIEGGPKFELGRLVATRAVAETGLDVGPLLRRHIKGDWGDVCEEDAEQNEWALKNDERLMSVYKDVPGMPEDIWIITERDRSVTTVLYPSDY